VKTTVKNTSAASSASGSMEPMRPRRVLPLAAAVLVASLAVAACGRGSDAPSSLQGVVRKPALQVASVTLPDESPLAAGAPFTMKAAKGGLLLAYFGYTNCPDVLPHHTVRHRTGAARAPRQRPQAGGGRVRDRRPRPRQR